ncbi:MAG: hypothetical protein M1817_004514 [Caeruleum heppii]|nr:MAG: hypothetical protein M1817_004514 [Caeruleum heppii]
MRSFRASPGLQTSSQRRLTQMYTDTKESCNIVTGTPKPNVDPELTTLHRKLRIQKDRLIAWGLDWSDAAAAQPADIDESLEREGFSNIVASVMSSIKELLEEAESMQPAGKLGSDAPKSDKERLKQALLRCEAWSAEDKPRYENLVLDLTDSIDILYNLSRSRRSAKEKEQTGAVMRKQRAPSQTSSIQGPDPQLSSHEGITRSPEPMNRQKTYTPRRRVALPDKSGPEDWKDSASTGATPVGLKSKRSVSTTSPPGESPRSPRQSMEIDCTRIFLPREQRSEQLPPYETIATPSNLRYLGQIRLQSVDTLHPDQADATVPCMVEFTGKHPATSLPRLQEVVRITNVSPAFACGLLRLRGYFQDANHGRFGLVYELPLPDLPDASRQVTEPLTLQFLLQASLLPKSSPVPNLEDRMHLARSIALTVYHVHRRGSTHRDVTSSNVVFRRAPRLTLSASRHDYGCNLREPYVTSFDLFSHVESGTGDGTRTNYNIYRHHRDTRNGDTAAWQGLRRSFDLYGLGLILLEIGLWMPLSSFWKTNYTATVFKKRIESIYVKKLGPKCGSLYLQAVEHCLSVADDRIAAGLNEPEQPVHEENESFFRKVIRRIQRCCLIDEDSPSSEDDSALQKPDGAKQLSVEDATSALKAIHKVPSLNETESTLVEPQPSSEDQQPHPKRSKLDETSPLRPQMMSTPSKGRLRVHPVALSQVQLKVWHRQLLPRIEQILVKVLPNPEETYTVDLIGVGSSYQSARPTIFVGCTSVGRVRGALNRHLKYDRETYDLKVRKGKLRRSAKKLLAREHCGRAQRSAASQDDEDEPKAQNGSLQHRPISGASIGVFKDDAHSTAVSFGGVVMVDDEPFGMTVHHVLEPDSDNEDADPASRDEPNALFPDETMASGDELEGLDGAYGRCYISDSEAESDAGSAADDTPSLLSDMEDNDEYDDDDVEDRESVISDTGDVDGVNAGEGGQYIVTQPALSDVEEDFFPNDADRNDDHLNSHRFGHVYASSGLRRCKRGRAKHEVDWALLKIEETRFQPYNVVRGGRRHCPNGPRNRPRVALPGAPPDEARDDLFPTQIAPMDEFAELPVHCVGRTSGLGSGIMSPGMSLVKMPGRRTPSYSWTVLGSFGMGGDSGAWVIDNHKGRVCGHVLAWCHSRRWAYICPMEILLDDIRRNLPATTVELPGAPAAATGADLRSQATRRPVERGASSLQAATAARTNVGTYDVQRSSKPDAVSARSGNMSGNLVFHDKGRTVACSQPVMEEQQVSG